MLFFQIYEEKKPQRYNSPHRHASTALHIHVCTTEDKHMQKIKCTANACWCGEAGARQHRCLRAAAHLPRMQPSTAADLSLRKRRKILPEVGDSRPCGVTPLSVCRELHKSHAQWEIDVGIDFLRQLVADNNGAA